MDVANLSRFLDIYPSCYESDSVTEFRVGFKPFFESESIKNGVITPLTLLGSADMEQHPRRFANLSVQDQRGERTHLLQRRQRHGKGEQESMCS